jgi:hypothetical protein
VILPFELSTPSAISAGIEVWTWVISERLGMEVALMTEVLSAWSDTIKFEKGIFSATQKWDLCFSQLDDFSYVPEAMTIPFSTPLSTALLTKESSIVRRMTRVGFLCLTHLSYKCC